MPARTVTSESDELACLVIQTVCDRQNALFKKLPLLVKYMEVHGKGGATRSGGAKWKADLEVREHGVLTGPPTGYEAMTLSGQSIFESPIYSPGFVVAPFMSSINERAMFNGS